ncbi:hypothetical protein G3I40_30435 [Streptomyces sp. SID14478]|uniref:hypothetical protein n=1 Tax=Streptomyces sp. SID14478 TaxID=2706073 RepID=UPI0013DA0F3E|nr:hypothetical protein [Streptomyces sp. SID14478]NEB79503.1 hypothetical protein [Streptomyces sp. SID14478]
MSAPDMTSQQLAGTWHIVCSSFPMWLSGKRAEPTFTYASLADGRSGAPRMSDQVTYRSGTRTRRILGVDSRLVGRPGTVFRWRGRGPLCLFTSEWAVTEVGERDSWAVIEFTRSLVSPAGTDVVVRAESLDDAAVLAAALDAGDRYGAARLPGYGPVG